MGREGKDSVFMRYTCVLPFYLFIYLFKKRIFFVLGNGEGCLYSFKNVFLKCRF
jgi:hypothetical protein